MIATIRLICVNLQTEQETLLALISKSECYNEFIALAESLKQARFKYSGEWYTPIDLEFGYDNYGRPYIMSVRCFRIDTAAHQALPGVFL